MSITVVSKDHPLCVTCNYWGGPRSAKLPFPSIFVEFDTTAKGQCLGGGFSNMQMLALAGCRQYEKWAVLR